MGTSSGSGHPLKGAIVEVETGTPAEVVRPGLSWAGIMLAWTAELRQRTGSERTPTEYGRYAELFRELMAGQGKDLDAIERDILEHREERAGQAKSAISFR